MKTELTLPMKSHFKKWLESNYDISPFDLDVDNSISLYIKTQLDNNLFPNAEEADILDKDTYNDTLDLTLTIKGEELHYFKISTLGIYRINKYVSYHFGESFYHFVNPRNKKYYDIKPAIFDFMDLHAINDDDIDYDSLRKKYFRIRQRKSDIEIRMKKINKNYGTGNLFQQIEMRV